MWSQYEEELEVATSYRRLQVEIEKDSRKDYVPNQNVQAAKNYCH